MENKAVVAKGEEQGLDKDGFSVRWTLENGLGLVFVVSRCPSSRKELC